MRILPFFLTAALLLPFAACNAPTAQSEAPVINGTCLISFHSLAPDRPTAAHLAGKTFLVSQNAVTWQPAGSLPLAAGWGLLEISESPAAITLNLDGVKLADVPK